VEEVGLDLVEDRIRKRIVTHFMFAISWIVMTLVLYIKSLHSMPHSNSS
jgi:hypothetical protein